MAASRIKARDPFGGGLPKMEASPNPSYRTAGDNNAEDGNLSDSDDGLPPPTDRELMKLMMARLAIMEQKVMYTDYIIIDDADEEVEEDSDNGLNGHSWT